MDDNAAQLRQYGLCGIFASAFMLVADGMLLATPASGVEIGGIWMDRLAKMPNWRLSVGGVGGPIGACFYTIGFWHVYLALKPGGKTAAFTCAAGFATSFIILGAFHAAFPFMAYMHGMESITDGLNLQRANAYFRLLGFVGMAPSLVSTIMFPCLLIFRRTHYPKWFVLLSPGVLYVTTVVFRHVPTPLGGFLMIGAGNLVFLAFFALSTVVLWNGGELKR